MQVIIIKFWMIKLSKTLCFCTGSLEINQWNVHCFTLRCVSEQGDADSGNGLLSAQHRVITWTNADFLSIGPLGTSFGENKIKIPKFLLNVPRKLYTQRFNATMLLSVKRWGIISAMVLFYLLSIQSLILLCKSAQRRGSQDLLCFYINTLRARQNGRRFPGDIFKLIFLNENVGISIRISLKFVPRGPINNNSALVQIGAD